MISDSTGETLINAGRAAAAQYPKWQAVEHITPMVSKRKQLENALEAVNESPGIVLYTIVDDELETHLREFCTKLGVPSLNVLTPVTKVFDAHLGEAKSGRKGAQHALDDEYFDRLDAVKFAMAHDDGNLPDDLEEVDIILIGISRTSKTPTSIYLANRGYKTGNIPLVPGGPLPIILDEFKHPFIVGLVAAPDRIVQIREQRLVGLRQNEKTDYIDVDRVRDEMREAKRMFVKKGYKVIDVTRKSIEETSAQIINAYQSRHKAIK
jgi:regulator of PEP synthase PpsR (kinase-PPPase family)